MEFAGEQVRRGQIWRRSLDEFCCGNPAGCWVESVYIHPGFLGGPGQISILNCDWSTIWDAVDAAGIRRSENAPLGYSCLTCWFQADFLEVVNSHWPLTSAGSLCWIPGEMDFYWPVTQAGSLSQPRGTLNSHWWRVQGASLYADEAVAFWEACERRLGAAYFPDFLKVQGRSGPRGIVWEKERGQEPNSDTFPRVAGSHHPLVRPHAVPGM